MEVDTAIDLLRRKLKFFPWPRRLGRVLGAHGAVAHTDGCRLESDSDHASSQVLEKAQCAFSGKYEMLGVLSDLIDAVYQLGSTSSPVLAGLLLLKQ